MSDPCISICIPTFNRSNYLGQTLKSILDQVEPENSDLFEICISDNASTDCTEELVLDIQKNSAVKIKFLRNEVNLGADTNFLNAVGMASGEYCWLMGSDDMASPGSLKILLQEIKSQCDIYICNRINCDINMNQLNFQKWLDNQAIARNFNLSNEGEFKIYAEKSLSIGAFFSYISSIIFNRSRWCLVEVDPAFIGTAYIHVYILLSFIKSKCMIRYLPQYLVKSRGGNDGFLNASPQGKVSRVMLDIRGYRMLSERVFSDHKFYYDHFIRVLHKERPPLKTLLQLRIHTNNIEWVEIKRECIEAGYSAAVLEVLSSIRPCIILLKYLRDKIKSVI